MYILCAFTEIGNGGVGELGGFLPFAVCHDDFSLCLPSFAGPRHLSAYRAMENLLLSYPLSWILIPLMIHRVLLFWGIQRLFLARRLRVLPREAEFLLRPCRSLLLTERRGGRFCLSEDFCFTL